jgi:hypothetical protein
LSHIAGLHSAAGAQESEREVLGNTRSLAIGRFVFGVPLASVQRTGEVFPRTLASSKPHREELQVQNKIVAGGAGSVAAPRPRRRRLSGVTLHNSILAACHVSISAAFSTSSSLHSPEKLWAVLSVGKAWNSMAMARRLIAKALGVSRNLLKVWFFGPHLASFEVANSNVANYLVFHGSFCAGSSEITVVHSFRQAMSLEQQLHSASLEVEDESNTVQFSVPLGSSQTTIAYHQRQTAVGSFLDSSTFYSSYHGSKKVFLLRNLHPS